MPNFDFLEEGLWKVPPLHILGMISQEKCFLCHILLTD